MSKKLKLIIYATSRRALQWSIPCIIIYSCDPSQRLIIKASEKRKTSVEVYAKAGVYPFPGSDTNRRIIIRVPFFDSSTASYQKTFSYGIGNWHKEALQRLATQIDSIILMSNSRKTTLKNDAILPYLEKHLSGYALSKVTIEAK